MHATERRKAALAAGGPPGPCGRVSPTGDDRRIPDRRQRFNARRPAMSWQHSKAAMGVRTGSATAKAVLLVLAEAANGRTGACTLSHATIADRAELSERAVWSAMRVLEDELQLIRRSRRADRRGQRTSDLISLRIGPQVAPSAVGLAPTKPQGVREGRSPPSRTSRATKPHLVQSQPAPGAEEPGREPGDEPGFSLIAQAPTEKSSRKKPARPLPADCPADRDLLWARGQLEERAPHLSPEDQAERFRSYHLARDSRLSDWSQAWRNWIQRAPEFSRGPRGDVGPRSALAWAVGEER